MTVSKSPERNTFQKNAYLKRCEESGEEPNQAYLKMYDDENALNEEWAKQKHKNDLEYDLRTTDWILEKARTHDYYAQNIYAALCNMQWQKLDVLPILKEQLYSCSWRYAGGIVADMLQKGDYIDWYCSGIRNDGYQDDLNTVYPNSYVSEGFVTEEIREDFKKLGWVPVPYEEE